MAKQLPDLSARALIEAFMLDLKDLQLGVSAIDDRHIKTVLYRHTGVGTLAYTVDKDCILTQARSLSGVSANWCVSFEGTTAADAAALNRVLPAGIIAFVVDAYNLHIPIKAGQIIYSAAAGSNTILVTLKSID